jgi:hypothetical protein
VAPSGDYPRVFGARILYDARLVASSDGYEREAELARSDCQAAPSGDTMTEIEYLLDRARSCRKAAGIETLPRESERWQARASTFECQAAALEARRVARK